MIEKFILVILVVKTIVLPVNSQMYHGSGIVNQTISYEKCLEIYAKLQKTGFTEPTGNGRELAKPNEFPYVAAIGWKNKNGNTDYNCSGILIAPNYVLAAAHCAAFTYQGKSASAVLLGEQELDMSKPSKGEIPVKRIIIHPNYKKEDQTYNDIALLELKSNSPNRPACLWGNSDVTNPKNTLVLYDRIDDTNKSKLLKVKTRMHSNEECTEDYKPARILHQGIIESQLCAEEIKSEHCRRISNGPLLCSVTETGKAVPFVIGISSFEVLCTDKDIPSVYTRISAYVNWIESIVWPNA